MNLTWFKRCMELGKWHHECWMWYIDPRRGYDPVRYKRAMQSGAHHQRCSKTWYNEARRERES